ncbi:hypothetical protein HK414_11595 [Ramlibacter terrae]|uniref:Uncharacterized protein n=1 Tax=Ramlibacter terrae TaxID=2732511 RepID=A0ABX6P2H1_9BURK|nr:hypothetical protein HK414_11595 [Ramlibacter terrae]
MAVGLPKAEPLAAAGAGAGSLTGAASRSGAGAAVADPLAMAGGGAPSVEVGGASGDVPGATRTISLPRPTSCSGRGTSTGVLLLLPEEAPRRAVFVAGTLYTCVPGTVSAARALSSGRGNAGTRSGPLITTGESGVTIGAPEATPAPLPAPASRNPGR